jgi:hypothetical protein
MHKLNQNVVLTELWNRVLCEKLIVMQVHSKFPAFCGTWKFITMYTTSSHLSLSWARLIQPPPWHHWIILMLSFRLLLILASGVLWVFILMHFSFVPWMSYTFPISCSFIPVIFGRVYKCWFLWCSVTSSSLIPVFLLASCSGAPAACAHSLMLQTKVHSDTHELHLLASAVRNVPGGLSDWLCSAVLPLILCFHGYTRAWLVCDVTDWFVWFTWRPCSILSHLTWHCQMAALSLLQMSDKWHWQFVS